MTTRTSTQCDGEDCHEQRKPVEYGDDGKANFGCWIQVTYGTGQTLDFCSSRCVERWATKGREQKEAHDAAAAEARASLGRN